MHYADLFYNTPKPPLHWLQGASNTGKHPASSPPGGKKAAAGPASTEMPRASVAPASKPPSHSSSSVKSNISCIYVFMVT
jgi:hypothetical protein